MKHYSKAELYCKIRELRAQFGICPDDYPLNVLDLCDKYPGIQVCFYNFKTVGLKGMAHIGEGTDNDVIIVNAKQEKAERNFTITHEVMHLIFHRDEPIKQFSCYDKVRSTQNSYVEWQANEGAAEFIIPAFLFLKIIKEEWNTLHTSRDFAKLKDHLSLKFNATPHVIEIRYEHLKYEIFQC